MLFFFERTIFFSFYNSKQSKYYTFQVECNRRGCNSLDSFIPADKQ